MNALLLLVILWEMMFYVFCSMFEKIILFLYSFFSLNRGLAWITFA